MQRGSRQAQGHPRAPSLDPIWFQLQERFTGRSRGGSFASRSGPGPQHPLTHRPNLGLWAQTTCAAGSFTCMRLGGVGLSPKYAPPHWQECVSQICDAGWRAGSRARGGPALVTRACCDQGVGRGSCSCSGWSGGGHLIRKSPNWEPFLGQQLGGPGGRVLGLGFLITGQSQHCGW